MPSFGLTLLAHCSSLLTAARFRFFLPSPQPANILLNENCTLKICDFGLSRVVTQDPPPLARQPARVPQPSAADGNSKDSLGGKVTLFLSGVRVAWCFRVFVWEKKTFCPSIASLLVAYASMTPVPPSPCLLYSVYFCRDSPYFLFRSRRCEASNIGVNTPPRCCER